MITTAYDLIKSCARDCGLLQMDTVPPNIVQDSIQDLNMLVDSLGIVPGMSRADVDEAFALTPNKRVYSIGLGCDFNTPKPWDVTGAYILDSANNKYEVGVITKAEYDQAYSDALITQTRPVKIVFDPGPTQQAVQMGMIICYPVPDASTPYLLHLIQHKPFTEFSSKDDLISFPSSYLLALRYNLDMIMWPGHREDGAPITANIRGQASKWMEIVKAMNAKPGLAAIEFGRKKGGSSYDINSGPYQGT